MAALESRTLLAAIVVNSAEDNTISGDGLVTLREAIAAANGDTTTDLGQTGSGDDTITFGDGSALGGTNFTDGTADTILLTQGELAITSSLTITGNGAANTIIDGNNASRIFNVDDGASTEQTVAITGVTLQHGNSATNGGAILNAENMTLAHSVIANNSAGHTHGRGSGGGIFSYGVFTSTSNTIANNSAHGSGGGIFHNGAGAFTSTSDTIANNTTDGYGGGIANVGAFTATSDTITNNSALSGGGIESSGLFISANNTIANNISQGNGGGIYNNGAIIATFLSTNDTIANNSAGTIGGGISNMSTPGYTATFTLINATIANNLAAFGGGGGIYNQIGFGGTVILNLSNTVIAGNADGDVTNGGTVTTNADNTLIGDASLSGTAGITNVAGGYAAIFGTNQLADNGGPTQTIALAANSPAINGGSDALVPNGITTDQRGVPFARISGGTVDIGAYEAQALNLVVDTNVDENDGNFASGDLSLREAIFLASQNPGADTITFGDGSANGGTNFTDGTPDTILLTQGELAITTSLTITGNGAANTIIDGNNASRIFNVDDGASIEQTVAITGVTLQHGKAAIFGGAILNAESLTLAHSVIANNSAAYGGGIYNQSGTFTSTSDAISNNSAGFGGGIYNRSGTFTSTSDAISNNSAGFGGGIYNQSGTFMSTDATIANNSAITSGGGILNLNDTGSTVNFTSINATIANNSAGIGGGIYNFIATPGTAMSNLSNTIIAGNAGGDVANFVSGGGTATTNADHTLVGDASLSGTAGITNVAGGYAAIFGTNQLANNGGPTQTIALAANSSAINAGSNALAVDANNQPLTTDQRGTGFSRFVGTVDIGAFEAQNAAPTAVAAASNPGSIAENTSTATRVKVADITITDDGNGTNVLTLTGADAGVFEIDGLELFIKAGTVLDFETKSTYSVTIEVDDSTVGTNPDATTQYTLNLIDVDDTPPTATIVVADSSLTIGETSLVTITFSEAVTGFDNTDLTIANGTLSPVSSGDGGVTWTATFTPTANVLDSTNAITLSNTGVQDIAGNSGVGVTTSGNFTIDTLSLGSVNVLPDPDRPGSVMLVVTGTNGNDTITVSKSTTGNSYFVTLNGKKSPLQVVNSRIIVRSLGGNDTISVANNITLPSLLDGGSDKDKVTGGGGNDMILGGEGDDTLYGVGGNDTLYGGNGKDTLYGLIGVNLMFGDADNDVIQGQGVLMGGAGNDTLTATGNRSVLIGGIGADTLTAARNGDILIGGTTDFDSDLIALLAIHAEWAAATPVQTRINHLTGAVAGGLNGTSILVRDALVGGTVHNDLAVDTFKNTFADDWLFTFTGDIRTRIVGRLAP